MATRRYKRDFKELETRRRRGMRMLTRGVSQSEVARACGVSRQTAMTWSRMLAEDAQAWRRRPLGRPGSLDSWQRARLSKLVVQGAVANGFATEMWTLARVAKLIEREFGQCFDLFGVTSDGIEQQVGSAHGHHFFELLSYLLWRAVHPSRRRQIRVVVYRAEPAMHLGLRDLRALVHRHEHPFGDGECRRIAPDDFQRCADQGDALCEGGSGRATSPHPAISDSRSPP